MRVPLMRRSRALDPNKLFFVQMMIVEDDGKGQVNGGGMCFACALCLSL